MGAEIKDLRELRGILKKPGAGVTLDHMNETIRAEGSAGPYNGDIPSRSLKSSRQQD